MELEHLEDGGDSDMEEFRDSYSWEDDHVSSISFDSRQTSRQTRRTGIRYPLLWAAQHHSGLTRELKSRVSY